MRGSLPGLSSAILPEELAAKLDKTQDAIYSKVYYLRKRGWTFGGDNAKR